MGKTILITGAARGIGHATAMALLKEGHHVVVLARDVPLTKEVLSGFSSTTTVLKGELGCLAAIEEAIQGIEALARPLDVVIHNAGIWPSELQLNEDGFERAFVVNHLAPFLINQRLMARFAQWQTHIVQVSAGLYGKGRFDLSKTPTGENFHSLKTYADTKLLNVMVNLALCERLPPSVRLNMVHPGVVRTNLGDRSGFLGWLLQLVKRFWLSPEQGASGPVHLATSEQLTGVSGCYYDQLKAVAYEGLAKDAALAEEVYQHSLKCCELQGDFASWEHNNAEGI